jgi:DNA-binding CsgD family transcriptional regulator
MLSAALGEARLAELREAGRSLTMDAVVAAAREVVRADDAGLFASHRGQDSGLTSRERQVLRLIAALRTDQDIADTLFLSRRTVNAHVLRILSKLDVHTRREAVERARELGLLTADHESSRHT